MIESLFPLGITHYLIGGLIIGAGVSFLFVTTGVIGGMSTVYSSTWSFLVNLPLFQRSGWGLCGVCPGPAIAGLGAGNWPLLVTVAAMLAGALAHGLVSGSRD